jgi:hypothetical protein
MNFSILIFMEQKQYVEDFRFQTSADASGGGNYEEYQFQMRLLRVFTNCDES